MQYLFKGRIAHVWLGLMLVTLAAWLFSGWRNADWHPDLAVSLTVVVVAVIKARFVLREFMEVGHASPWLRGLTDVWVVGLPLALYAATLV